MWLLQSRYSEAAQRNYPTTVTSITTEFKRRLQANDDAAWNELERDFGALITAGIRNEGCGRFHQATIQDLRQEALASLAKCIGNFDARQEGSFSAWLFNFGRNAARNERRKRTAVKRGGGTGPVAIEGDVPDPCDPGESREFSAFDAEVFRAKVMRAVRIVEGRLPLFQFQIYYMKVASGTAGIDLAAQYGLSQATITRHQRHVRDLLRKEIARSVREFSWNTGELQALSDHGLDRAGESEFDDALSGILRSGQGKSETASGPCTTVGLGSG